MASKVALVTGGSSGIGVEISRLLISKGWRVFAASRHPERTAFEHEALRHVHLDVTDDTSVSVGVQSVLEQAGRLDVLINNAGYALLGALEDTSLAEAREQFETNFFGVVRMTHAVLPMMRQQGHGRLVNISSVVGLLPAPYMGIYAASKHAVEGYTETLDHEIREFGVRAVLVEPYFTKTSLTKNGRFAASSLEAYQDQRTLTTAAIQQMVTEGETPRAVAEIVWRAISAKNPRPRYAVGRSVRLGILRRFVPDAVFAESLRKQYQMRPARINRTNVDVRAPH